MLDPDLLSRGLSTAEVVELQKQYGKNEVSGHKAHSYLVLLRQLKNPILWLLGGALIISALLGDSTNALIISVIVSVSIGLGFLTEYRAEKAVEDLHSRIKHHATVIRDGAPISIETWQLVPGDLVQLRTGSVVPADITLISSEGIECDESIITGESLPVRKDANDSLLMGTVVRTGAGLGRVTAIGGATEFGRIAAQLGRRAPETNFQIGLKHFSIFLLRIAISITVLVIIGNIYLKRPVIESILYALALAVGMTPQLLPAIVSTALAMGSKRLTRVGVLVKRLVSIEDLGDVDILLTDKTGTLTSGAIEFDASYPVGKGEPVAKGLLATESDYSRSVQSKVGLSPIDAALWSAQSDHLPRGAIKIAEIPFDHVRRRTSTLARIENEYLLATKGSPEDVLPLCAEVSATAHSLLDSLYKQGARVIAVASKKVDARQSIAPSDEVGLVLDGFLAFTDPVKDDARDSLDHLRALGIEVKVATGDSAEVALTTCEKVGLEVRGLLLGKEIDALDDQALRLAATETTIFARVSPEQKARILAALRSDEISVAFLGDGVNDAIALHDADVGISVESATDVARDAADVVLLKKDLGILADGIREGRRVFSNTMKYIFMATSADFGNLISASLGSLILPFLPMLPTQVLLQDLLYDASQLAIPSDRVDREQVMKPSHWNIAAIRRFMLIFGVASSIFDFATFGILLWVLHAGEAEFHTGWFIESLATATLVVLVIRTRRVPFFTSRPARSLLFALLGVNAIAFVLTISPFASDLGLSALPLEFYLALAAMVVAYLALVEWAKRHLTMG